MISQTRLSIHAFQRIHSLRPVRSIPMPAWWYRCKKKPLVGGLLLCIAIGIHFFFCDWRLPRREYSHVSGRSEWVPYENQLLGFIHANGLFRTTADSGAMYDLNRAAFCGLFVPLLMGFIGSMLVVSEWSPDPWKKAIRQRMAAALARFSPRLAAAATLLTYMMYAGGTTIVGAAIYSSTSQPSEPKFVASAADSYVADQRAAAAKRASRAPTTSGGSGKSSSWLARLFSGSSSDSSTPSSSSTSTSSSSSASPSSSYSGSSYSGSSSGGSGAAVTPEPSTFVMLGVLAAAGTMVAGWRRRRRVSVAR